MGWWWPSNGGRSGRMFSVALAVLAVLVVRTAPSGSVSAAVIYYVSTTGLDVNPGTLSAPFRTIQSAVNVAAPGDTILVRGGRYAETVRITRAGQSGRPITVAPYQSENVTIDGGSGPAILTGYLADYWIIERMNLESDATWTIEFDGWACDGTCGGSNHWLIRNNHIVGAVSIYGSYNLLEGNVIDGTQHRGSENGVTEFYDASHHNTFRGNHIYGFKERGIWSLHRTHDSVFENNHIHGILSDESNPLNGIGIDLDGFGNVEWRHTVRGNLIYDCGNSGITLENTFDSIVENNIIHDRSNNGIEAINYGWTVPSPGNLKCGVGGESSQYGDTDGNNDCEGDDIDLVIRQNLIYGVESESIALFHVSGVEVLGNTVYGGGAPALFVDEGTRFCSLIRVRGNIFAQNQGAEIRIRDAQSLSVDSANLLYHTGTGSVYEIQPLYYTLSQYRALTGGGSGSIEAAPGFVSASWADFHLQESSPAVDAGQNVGISYDLDGRFRPQGNGYDMGVFEYASGAPPTPSPGPTIGHPALWLPLIVR
jgi:hypothetical protein